MAQKNGTCTSTCDKASRKKTWKVVLTKPPKHLTELVRDVKKESSRSGLTPQGSQSVRPLSPSIAPPQAPRSSNTPLPDTETALSQPPAPQYLFCPTKA